MSASDFDYPEPPEIPVALAVGREGRGLGREPDGFAELHRRAVIAGSSARCKTRPSAP